MVRLDLHEQEQVNKLKYFWQDYGRYIVGIVVVAIIAYVSNTLWTLHIQKQSQQAALLYANLDAAAMANDKAQVIDLNTKLQRQFPDTKYAVFASMWAAQAYAASANFDDAALNLKWVIDHAKDRGLAAVARLRLANIYIDQKRYTQALELMMAKPIVGFEALYYAKRGDIYLAQGDKQKTVAAYEEVLKHQSSDSPIAQSVRTKLQLLGVAAAPSFNP